MFKAVWLLCKRKITSDTGFRKWWTKQVYAYARDQLLRESRDFSQHQKVLITSQVTYYRCCRGIHLDVDKFPAEDNELAIVMHHRHGRWQWFWK